MSRPSSQFPAYTRPNGAATRRLGVRQAASTGRTHSRVGFVMVLLAGLGMLASSCTGSAPSMMAQGPTVAVPAADPTPTLETVPEPQPADLPADVLVVRDADDSDAQVTPGRQPAGTPYPKVEIIGGTPTQRGQAKTWLKEWGKYTDIRSVTITPTLRGGRAFAYADGSADITISESLGTGTAFRYTFLHELAHAQANYVYEGFSANTDRELIPMFGAVSRATVWKGIEAAADCGAQYMSGSKKHLYYRTGGCTKAQLTRAKRIANGHRL